MTRKILELAQGMEKGGRTKRIAETAMGLSRLGWQVQVLSMTPVPDWVRALYENKLSLVTVKRRPKLDLPYVLKLAKFIRDENVSLIHAHCEASYFYGGLAGKLCRIPVVGTYHRSDLSYFRPDRKLRLFANLLTRAVAISNDRMSLMLSTLNVKLDKITLVHGGIDLDSFEILPDPEIMQLRKDFNLGNRRVLLSVGHLGPIKGHQVTLQALPRVLEHFPDVVCVIAGDGSKEDFARLKRMINDLGLEQHVRLLGQIHNVIEWLNVCDLFVQPSLEEGFGLVFVEAGACRKAVVSTAVGGIKDIVQHGKTGLLVEPEDAEGLADALSTLLADPQKAREFGTAGWERVHRNFSLRSMAEKYNDLFASLLDEPGASAIGAQRDSKQRKVQ